jgi:hypothetical protein
MVASEAAETVRDTEAVTRGRPSAHAALVTIAGSEHLSRWYEGSLSLEPRSNVLGAVRA